MRLIVSASEELADVVGMIAFVEADVLSSSCRLRSMDRNAVEGGFEKFDIVSVGATDLHSQGYAACVSEHRSFGSQLAAIGRIFAGIFPHPEATWSSLRPHFANSTEYP